MAPGASTRRGTAEDPLRARLAARSTGQPDSWIGAVVAPLGYRGRPARGTWRSRRSPGRPGTASRRGRFTGPLLSPGVLGGCSAHAAHAMRDTRRSLTIRPPAHQLPPSARQSAPSTMSCVSECSVSVSLYSASTPSNATSAVRPSASTVSTLSTGSPCIRDGDDPSHMFICLNIEA